MAKFMVDPEKARRAHTVVDAKGQITNNPDKGQLVEEKAYELCLEENPKLSGDELVLAIYKKIGGLVSEGSGAEEIKEAIKPAKLAGEKAMGGKNQKAREERVKEKKVLSRQLAE